MVDTEMVAALAGMTDLSVDAATVLLEAADGDLALAASLHFDAEPDVAVPAAALEGEDPSPIRPTPQRYAVLGDLCDKDGSDDDDDDLDVFARLRRGGGSSGGVPFPAGSGAHSRSTRRGSKAKARGSRSSRGGDDDDLPSRGGEYDMLALTADADDELRAGSVELFPSGRRRGKGTRSTPIRIQRPSTGGDDDSASDHAISPSPTDETALRSSTQHRRRARRGAGNGSHQGSHQGGGSPRISGGVSGSCGAGASGSFGGSPRISGGGVSGSCGAGASGSFGGSQSSGSFSASDLGLSLVRSVRGFAAP